MTIIYCTGTFFDMYIEDVPVCNGREDEMGRNVATIQGHCEGSLLGQGSLVVHVVERTLVVGVNQHIGGLIYIGGLISFCFAHCIESSEDCKYNGLYDKSLLCPSLISSCSKANISGIIVEI